MARADLYKDDTGFRLLEWNLGSTVGGAENVDLCRALALDPELAAFLEREGLGYAATDEALLATLRVETDLPHPVVALVDTPGMYAKVGPILHAIAERWRGHGLTTDVGHLGELTRTGGRLCLRGRPIDVVFRVFTFEDALVHLDDGVLEPLLTAAEHGEVTIFTPLDAELYGSKAALALLSEPEGQAGLTPVEQDACARLLPWTRLLSPELVDFALQHRAELVLKPGISYGGNGVLVGSDPRVTPEAWRDAVTRGADGSSVLQQLVQPVPEMFPTATGLVPFRLAWGVFTTERGYAGALVRGVPAETDDAVLNVAQGALVGGCFHPREESA